MKNLPGCALLLSLLAVAGAGPAEPAQAQTGADVLPETTAIYVEINRPAEIFDTIFGHPLRERIEQLDDIRRALRGPQMLQLKFGVGLLETQVGTDWQTLLKSLIGGGIYLGVDPQTQGIALLVHARDEDKLKRTAGIILNFIKQQNPAEEPPFKTEKYRGHNVAKFPRVIVARINDWLLVCNRSELAKTVADNLLDGTDHSLASVPAFANHRDTAGGDRDVWSYVDLDAVRQAGLASQLFRGRAEDPRGELILGGMLEVLEDTPSLTAALDIDAGGIRLATSVPFDASKVQSAREYFFGPQSKGQAPPMLKPKNFLAGAVAYRDLSQWWLSKEDLFDENVIAQLSQTDSQLSTIFAGLDFGQEVLGSLKPGVQIVAAGQPFDSENAPDIKLPAFALVSQLESSEQVQRRFKVAFQSLIGFFNIALGQQGQPQLELSDEQVGGIKLTSATYFLDEGAQKGLINYNFSPTIAFRGDHFIVSSTRELALELAQLTQRGGAARPETNTAIEVDGNVLHAVLQQNREALIAQNMLEEGSNREAAENQIETILSVLQMIDQAAVDFQVQPDRLLLEVKIQLVQQKTGCGYWE